MELTFEDLTEEPVESEFEEITDEMLVSLIEAAVHDSNGNWLEGTELTAERQKATLEYGMIPTGHLTPQGVSRIVSSDTVEAIEGYLAVIAELLFNNKKIARFTGVTDSPKDTSDAKKASEFTDYIIFKMNPGWAVMNDWVKATLLWKNSQVRWEFVEDHEYKFEEYATIDQNNLDLLLADPNTDLVSSDGYTQEEIEIPDPFSETGTTPQFVNVWHDVRLRVRIPKNRIKISGIPPENFRISKDATCIEDASFVGIQSLMTRGEIRKQWPHIEVDFGQVSSMGVSTAMISQEEATRKMLTAVEAVYEGHSKAVDTETNTEVEVTECWIRVDRDGDGISELKHIILAGQTIILEEDVDCVDIASLVPFRIPYEFFGLSMADVIRPSTQASTAILRGFVENVYMTNYSPKLADPNVVDFGSLQNLKPKQIIPTNGNPNQAVASLTPDTISQGTVPLLEYIQIQKEQATGLSKAAQGLNDTLYVSGNSEEKLARVQDVAQVRIQYMVRQFVETGIKRMVEGVYKMAREKFAGQKIDYYDAKNHLKTIDLNDLPSTMMMEISADVGEHSNSNKLKKMEIIGDKIIPALQSSGAGGAVNPEAALRVAANIITALDEDPLDYLVDYTDPEFKEKAQQSREMEARAAEAQKRLEEELRRYDIEQRKATLALTNIQSKNALQDNTRQMVIAIDKHYQEWGKLWIQAAKEGVTNMPPPPDINHLWTLAQSVIDSDASAPLGTPEVVVGDEDGVVAATPTGVDPTPMPTTPV